jgi:hypothetical protein
MRTNLIFINLLIVFTTFSQTVIKGTVKDSTGKPLEMANVIAVNLTDTSMEGYSITDTNGKYSIEIKNKGDIELKVSYLGYDSQSKILVVEEGEIIKNFILEESKSDLEPVEITYEMPVTIKGDTIVYNTDSFTTGKEKKLGDVLNKLPGMEINKEGEIEVEGKKVSKVMVDGKDFFDGDTKLATKNIPADAIKKVEVLKNYNEVSQMRGLGDDSDNIALNIKLKEGKKNFWFGEISAGAGEGGNKARYIAHPKLFYYSPKNSINIITDVNNIGEIPFTFSDYFKFTGGFKKMKRGGGINVSSNSLGLTMVKDNKAKEISNEFGAINFSQKISNKLDLSGFAIYSGSHTKMQTNTLKTNTVTDINGNIITTNENVKNRTQQDNKLGLLKLSASYKPNVLFQLDYDVLMKKSDLLEGNKITSFSDITGLNDISSNKNESPFSINQNTNIYYTLNEKNIFSFGGQFIYEKNTPLYQSINTDQRFTILPTVNQGTDFNLNQNKKITNQKVDLLLDYYYILNNKRNLNFSFGAVLNKQKLTTQMHQILDDDSVVEFNDSSLKNDVSFLFADLFFGIHYKIKTGKFLITPGLSIHNYKSLNKQLGDKVELNVTKLLPDLNVKFSIKRSESIRFNYETTTDFTDVNKLAEGIVMNSYNSLSFGNRNLSNALYQKINLQYFSFNMFSYTNVHAFINYSKKYDIIKQTANLIGIDRVSTFKNIDDPEDNFNVNASISKRIKKIKARLSINTNITNSYRLTTLSGGDIIKTKTKFSTYGFTTSLQSNFVKWPNFEIGFKSSLSKFDSSESVTNKPFANIEVVFLKDFVFVADYKFNNYHNKTSGIKNTYDFLNTDLYYQKEGSKWEFKLSAINLLNVKSINEDYFSEFLQSSSRYIVQPRMFMFTVKYDL